ncbi:MAG: HPP family protein [Pseudomonadota bacterium]|uniref:HPP family protein n=1 Tax=Sphingomonas sp. ERG5 TaxID=1381597 RepID=UPI000ADCE3D4|nr:HPP family protein [Sphingomonas sp. ERG5]
MFRRHAVRLFVPMLAGGNFRDRLWACLGALIGIALTALLCSLVLPPAAFAMLVAPIGASAVLLFAVPASPLAQPWSIIGGNMISAIIGVAVAQSMAPPVLAVGLAVGGAILAMSLLRCLHPPGGAVALTALIGGPMVAQAGFLFALAPVGLNSALLVLTGIVFHRLSGHSYPHRAVPVAGHVIPPQPEPFFHPEDVDRALADLGETFDVGKADLELLFRQVELHARERTQRSA